ncbi:zinc ABC transporter substrate-binding protein [Cryobacterium frigoriphilum]|uniref:Zinc ABC transporter substrate-binding protein n=1 Tax=Cryobacterium frigoriphilum TaxID=1259150 RepID=A0A4R8ZW38_9MICO|nr:metal ABC transporter substrate-binding protein [Cryobacterium frigoriphilum]TFD47798.1 zinc ABC transporter substrate-binding protein [Cryobacterium frigoriphilum]
MHKRYFAAPALLAGAALALSGCASTPTSNTGTEGDLRVVATTTQIADFTRSVVGDAEGVSITQLVQPNQSLHSYDPSAADLTALGAADVLVINGVDLEEWLDDAIDASGFDGVTIDSDEGIDIIESEVDDHAGETEAEHAEHADETEEEHAAEEAAEAAESEDDEHAHDGGDPHIWTDVSNALTMVGTIATGLEDASPDAAADITANAAAYSAQLTELDSWIRTNVETVPAEERLLVSNHDALGYYTAAYGITYVGAVIPSFDDNAEPSAAAIDELVAAISATGVQAVFSEASLNPKTADTIASEAGVTVYSGDDALYVDSLGPQDSAGDTYLKAQLHNTTLILESWGVTPTDVPADLEK